jgi:dienelactone hydrolase
MPALQGVAGGDNGRVAQVVVFHSAYGLRQVELTAAERLRAAGHDVLTPDLLAPPIDGGTHRIRGGDRWPALR